MDVHLQYLLWRTETWNEKSKCKNFSFNFLWRKEFFFKLGLKESSLIVDLLKYNRLRIRNHSDIANEKYILSLDWRSPLFCCLVVLKLNNQYIDNEINFIYAFTYNFYVHWKIVLCKIMWQYLKYHCVI